MIEIRTDGKGIVRQVTPGRGPISEEKVLEAVRRVNHFFQDLSLFAEAFRTDPQIRQDVRVDAWGAGTTTIPAAGGAVAFCQPESGYHLLGIGAELLALLAGATVGVASKTREDFEKWKMERV